LNKIKINILKEKRANRDEEKSRRQEERNQLFNESTPLFHTRNFLAVHITKYPPKKNAGNETHIPSSAMATDFLFPRSTVHFTLDHMVGSSDGGDWSGMPIVILTPFNELVQKNGPPALTFPIDTYWTVNPDKGIVLPHAARKVEPSDKLKEGVLYFIGPKKTLYKRAGFTNQEKRTLLNEFPNAHFGDESLIKNGDDSFFANMNRNLAAQKTAADRIKKAGLTVGLSQYDHSSSVFSTFDKETQILSSKILAIDYLLKNKHVGLTRFFNDTLEFKITGWTLPYTPWIDDRGFISETSLREIWHSPSQLSTQVFDLVNKSKSIEPNLYETMRRWQLAISPFINDIVPVMEKIPLNQFISERMGNTVLKDMTLQHQK
jgi:hypothetical protein